MRPKERKPVFPLCFQQYYKFKPRAPENDFPKNVKFKMDRMDKPKNMKILALPLYGIGDVLMTTPALRNIKEKLPSASLTYLHMFKTTRDVLIKNPNVDENIYFPFLEAGRLAGARFILGLRGRYDIAINFYPSNRRDYNLASFLSGCPVRIGHTYVKRNIKELNFLKNRTFMEDDNLHNVEENLRLLGFLGIKDPCPYPMEIFLTEEEEKEAALWLREKGISEDEKALIVGFHPGTSAFKEHVNKRWPAQRFSVLIDMIAAISPASRFLIFGGTEEAGIKEDIKRGCSRGASRVRAVDTRGIRQTAALMKRCGLFISNDSGLMHLSAALKVPTVGIFGPTNPGWVSPWGERTKVVQNPGAGCEPCFRYSPEPLQCRKKYDFRCLQGISAEEVLEAARSLVPF